MFLVMKMLSTSDEVLVNWDELKKKEKSYETLAEEINGIAKTFQL